jgi:hypothetical protein
VPVLLRPVAWRSAWQSVPVLLSWLLQVWWPVPRRARPHAQPLPAASMAGPAGCAAWKAAAH